MTVRAFIPEKQIQYPPAVGPKWKGDDRSFSNDPNAKHRAQVSMTIETDPKKSAKPLVGKPETSTSGSEVDILGKKFTGQSKVTTDVSTNGRTSDGTSVVTVSISASDPLVPGAPPTSATLTFTVSSDGNVVGMNGAISAYPAWEAYADRPSDGAQGTLLEYSPVGTSANSPGALLTGATMDVSGKTTMQTPTQGQDCGGRPCPQGPR